ncbi:MAG: HAD-IIIC family phosphatase [Deltaproteobacteria bacterium]|nr:HAD-IIIC family phosphatase [Deltaproteobacteria bacterium]NIS77096.1 HAD-IIIC family phosphatase [Deltaproteobacteria bacterium]
MEKTKKCVIWDLDDTLWDGVCLEGDVKIRPEVCHVIEELDSRGILHSIASRGEEDVALAVLKEHNLYDLFLVPQINWEPKPKNIITITKELGIGLDSIAFVDDDSFELEQVAYMLPEVMTINARSVKELPLITYFNPEKLTEEGRARRRFYQAEQQRKEAESRFSTREEFLKSCNMCLRIRPMKEDDIPRILELMSRTHQLNTVGRVLPQDELNRILRDEAQNTEIYVADLADRFGDYGTIGVAIVDSMNDSWTLRYLAVSCRVLGRGVERSILTFLVHDASKKGFSHVDAAFRDTGRNRPMRGLYQMMGFRVLSVQTNEGTMMLRASVDKVSPGPKWVEVI